MADGSKIEWTETTWNVITGCTKVSEGCDHCYIERTPPFRMAGRRFDKPGVGGTTGLQPHHDRLDLPLRWRKPRRVFVNSLADLFHVEVPDAFIAEVFARMWWAPQHTFQVLTKRHARLRTIMPRIEENLRRREHDLALMDFPTPLTWPLPNVWMGVSVENANHLGRIDCLRQVPAAVRFLSAEPLLGPLTGLDLSGIGWVIAGGESGPGARPMHPDWARSLRDQCTEAGVRYFFKQFGEWWPIPAEDPVFAGDRIVPEYGHDKSGPFKRGWAMRRLGKKRAGRLLDGRTWDEYPNAAQLEEAGI